MKKLKEWFKGQTVFCVSLVLALASCLAVPPGPGYAAYPDWRTLALLFCLMILVAGLRGLGVFDLLGRALLGRVRTVRALGAVLVLLCFFASMVITNDVALITFVPFTIAVYRTAGLEGRILHTVVLQTIAANLGSMATPIGNPQNLYLCSASGMSAGQFLQAVGPYAALSLALLGSALALQPAAPLPAGLGREGAGAAGRVPGRAMAPYLALLGLCLLVVFRVVGCGPVFLIVAAAVAVLDRRLYRKVDYFLLGTFLCFFVFIGNLKQLPGVSEALRALVDGRELWMGVAASQVISNVPAAILLAGFTDNYPALLTGVNLGGLGTPIASLASLISYQFCARELPGSTGRFLKVFTLWNAGFLAALAALALALG